MKMFHLFKFLTIIGSILIFGCATQGSLYQSWGKQLAGAADARFTVDDVSLLLSAKPSKCEQIKPPLMVGVTLIDKNGPVVAGISPNGAASEVDIRIGDKITSINSKRTMTAQNVIEVIKLEAQTGQPINIKTQRGVYTLIPKTPKEAMQCYWEINAGQIGSVRGGAYVDQSGGFANQSGSAYQRFFRATCRFYDGFAGICQANWQE